MPRPCESSFRARCTTSRRAVIGGGRSTETTTIWKTMPGLTPLARPLWPSVGLEHIDDIHRDIDQALAAAPG